MISSGASEGASGFAGGGGVGNFVESGGCIGPATCARSKADAVAKTRASVQHAARKFVLEIMESTSICLMPFAGLLQHGSLKNPVHGFPLLAIVYRGAPQ